MDWQTAQAPLIFFEGENEEKLVSEFVGWRAKHPNRSIFEICAHIFRDLKDNTARANQAALKWQDDLSIIERIDAAKNNGGVEETNVLTKAQLQAKILAVVENDYLTPQEKTARLKGLTDYASLEGWVIKAVEKQTKDVTNRRPTIVISQASAR